MKKFTSPYTLKSRKSEIDHSSRPKGKRFSVKLVGDDDMENKNKPKEEMKVCECTYCHKTDMCHLRGGKICNQYIWYYVCDTCLRQTLR